MSQEPLHKIHTGARIGGISNDIKNEAAVQLCTSRTGWATNKLSSVHDHHEVNQRHGRSRRHAPGQWALHPRPNR
jgi:uncharacterized protein YjhX (UPF0386 family)